MGKNIINNMPKSKKPSGTFTIVSEVRNHARLPAGIYSPRTLYRYVKILVTEGVLIKKGYGTWDINLEKWEIFKEKHHHKQYAKNRMLGGQLAPSSKISIGEYKSTEIRGHGFQFMVAPGRNLVAAGQQALRRKGVIFYPLKDGDKGIRFVFKNHKMWLSEKSLLIFCPRGVDYFGKTAGDSKKSAVYDFIKLVKSLEAFLGFSFERGGKLWWNVTRQHYADINNELAKIYGEEHKTLKVSDENGVWMVIDYSLEVPELETVHSKTADADMDTIIKPFFADLKRTGLMPSVTLQMINAVVENQNFHAENLRSHVGAVQDLSKGVNELRGAVGNLVDVVKKIENRPDSGSILRADDVSPFDLRKGRRRDS